MRKFWLLIFPSFALIMASLQSVRAEEINWAEEAKKIKYLSPDAFPNVPKSVRVKLTAMRCQIPQADFDSDGTGHEPNNLIKGSFTGKNKAEWAALCSVNKESKLVLLYGKNFSRMVELSPTERDQGGLQGSGDGNAYYSWVISTVNPAGVKHYLKRDGMQLQNVNHDGISVGFQGKGSNVRYFYQGKWIEIPGAD